MTRYHAVIIDETGCEFGASVEAPDRESARRELKDQYPECRNIEQIETLEEAREREDRVYQRAASVFDSEYGDLY